MRIAFAVAFALQFVCGAAWAAPARPIDPIAGIIDAFKTHDVVALDEGSHGNEQGAAFRQKLYRDPRFQAVVSDIVVEAGNARHQAMMDRYIAGEDVPEKQLRMAWIETTQGHDVWDKDIYADLFRTIREVNQMLPKTRRLRVLLGDYPYDSAAAPAEMMRPDSFTAELIQREVIAKGRKALMVYGGMHYLRRQFRPPSLKADEPTPLSIVGMLEKSGVKVFSIYTFTPARGADLKALQADIGGWPKPSLTLIKDTILGAAPFTFYYPKGVGQWFGPGLNGPVSVDISEAIGGVLQAQFDAILYLGPKTEITYAKLSTSLCSDPAYVEMRARRMGAFKFPDGADPGVAAFRARCKSVLAGK